jgi:hypothetical protein
MLLNAKFLSVQPSEFRNFAFSILAASENLLHKR